MKRLGIFAAAAVTAVLLGGCRGGSRDSNAPPAGAAPRAVPASRAAASTSASAPAPPVTALLEADLIRLLGEIASAIPGGWYVENVQTGLVSPPGRPAGTGHRIVLMEIPLSWGDLTSTSRHRADLFLISPGVQAAAGQAIDSQATADQTTGAAPTSLASSPTGPREWSPTSAPAIEPAVELRGREGWRVYLWQDAFYSWPQARQKLQAAVLAACAPPASPAVSPAAPNVDEPPKAVVGFLTLYRSAGVQARDGSVIDFRMPAYVADEGSESNVPITLRSWQVQGPCWRGEGLYVACFRDGACTALVPLDCLCLSERGPLPSSPPAIEVWDVPGLTLELAVWEDGTILRRPTWLGPDRPAGSVLDIGWVRPALVHLQLREAVLAGAMGLPLNAAQQPTPRRRMCLRIAGRTRIFEVGAPAAATRADISPSDNIRALHKLQMVWGRLDYSFRQFRDARGRPYSGAFAPRMPELGEDTNSPSLVADDWGLSTQEGNYPTWNEAESPGAYAWRAGLQRSSLNVKLSDTVSMTFQLVPPGHFHMGSPPEEPNRLDSEAPRHEVFISRPFFLAHTEVTRAQFAAFVADANATTAAEREGWAWAWRGRSFEGARGATWRDPGFAQTDNHPVTEVSYSDALAFCEWLSRRSGQVCRLPTEAEWEYACRAGAETAYTWGDDANGGAGCCNVADRATADRAVVEGQPFDWDDRFAFTAPVASFHSNLLGLYDMHGNVWEWCSDWFDEDYYMLSPPFRDPKGPLAGTMRVVRGGGWRSGPADCRAARRLPVEQDLRRFDIGFRVLMELEPKPGVAATAPAGPASASSRPVP